MIREFSKGKTVMKTLRISALAAVFFTAAACGTEGSTTAPTADLNKLPWKLTLNHHAITTMVNTPVQLSYEVTNVKGDVLTGLPAAEFATSDTSVKVDDQLRLTASTYSTLRYVYVTITALDKSWKVADTIRVGVDTAKAVFSTVEMALNVPLVAPMNRTPSFPLRMFTSTGDTVRVGTTAKTIHGYYESSAPAAEYYSFSRWNTNISPRGPYSTQIVSTAHIYGQTYKDTLNLRALMPDSATVLIQRVSTSLNPSPSAIGQGDLTILKDGKVNFRNNNPTLPADIKFDNLTGVIDGDIPVVPTTIGAIVTFPNTGKFTYRSNAVGSSFVGTITVIER